MTTTHTHTHCVLYDGSFYTAQPETCPGCFAHESECSCFDYTRDFESGTIIGINAARALVAKGILAKPIPPDDERTAMFDAAITAGRIGR